MGTTHALLPLVACALCALVLQCLGACAPPRVGSELRRRGDEIVVAGRFFHTGAPVVLWTDPDGYDAYRVERRFVPADEAGWEASHKAGLETPNRYGTRRVDLTPEEADAARAGNWTLPMLQKHVDQFVIHYDVAGTSRSCFRVLHDARCLSVHFMIDLDGTIYQTLDAKERAWHASHANDRSVGVEIANIGAYPPDQAGTVLPQWYTQDERGTRVSLPTRLGDGGIRTPGFVARPARPDPITGPIHGEPFTQYDFTPEQYESLARLAAALHIALPRIALDCPRDAAGAPLARACSPEEWAAFHGLIGHFHLTDGKVDPGPAFQWNNLLERARAVASVGEKAPLGPSGGWFLRYSAP